MATYYVDSAADAGGNGTTTALTGANCAFKTLAQVNAKAFSPGDFCLFNRGQTWVGTLTPGDSGTYGHNITYGAYGSGAQPIIDATDLSYGINGIKDYITITDFALKYARVAGVGHSRFDGSVEHATPGWVIQNCTLTECSIMAFGPNTIIQDNVLTGPNGASADAGAITVRGLVASNCQVLRNTVSGFAERGIWFLIGASSPTVSDNIVHDISGGEGYGIDFDGYGQLITGVVTCTGNTVYNVAPLWGIYMENCSGGSVIKNNLVYNCTDAGIAYMNYFAFPGHYVDQRGNNIGGQVSYNVIYGCNKGLYAESVSGIDFWNNVVDDPAGATPKGIGIAAASPAYTTDIDIRNNVFGSGLTYVCSIPGNTWTDVIAAFDYNAVEDITIMYEHGDSHSLNLATLQAGGKATHCFTTDPAFIDGPNHNYALDTGSPCIDTGVNVGLTNDFNGDEIFGVPDIGAYEYGSTHLPDLYVRVHGGPRGDRKGRR
jgi:hypothetical protein